MVVYVVNLICWVNVSSCIICGFIRVYFFVIYVGVKGCGIIIIVVLF